MIKTEEKTAGGAIGSASEGKDRDANWRISRRIYGQDDCVFNGNPASNISISGYDKNVIIFEITF
jgi:hypothetical protein